jgi:hypothetical protein
VLKQVTGDTHANVQVKVKRTRTVEANYNAHANLRLGFKRTSQQRELGWTTDTLTKGDLIWQEKQITRQTLKKGSYDRLGTRTQLIHKETT